LKFSYLAGLSLLLGSSALGVSATLKGTVRNETTGKPAAGDYVILLSPGHGSKEIARGQTDAFGHFSLNIAVLPVSSLVRVVHQGVDYGRMAPSGGEPFEVQVYDVASELKGVTVTLKAQRYQTERDALQVIEEILVRNSSDPPRALRNFEFRLPPEAEIVNGAVQTGGGRPIKRMPTAGDEKGQYYFQFPVRPGNSRFAVAYRLPYESRALIEARSMYPLDRFEVILPQSMKFEAIAPGNFQPMPGEGQRSTQLAGPVKPGESLAFRVSGTGKLEEVGSAGKSADNRPQTAQRPAMTVPAGDLPHTAQPSPPAQNFRWFLLAGMFLVPAAGVAGFLQHKREKSGTATKLVVIGALMTGGLQAFPTGPPAGVSGAPGEVTCSNCHRGGMGGGKVEIAFPAGLTYAPGAKQPLTISITDPDALRFGFQLSARLAGDNSQAGTLAPAAGQFIKVICADSHPRPSSGCPASAPIEYIEHSTPGHTNTFKIEWTPPATDPGPVKIYIAANAANGNGNSSGDDIYTANYTLTPQPGQSSEKPRITSAGIVSGANLEAGTAPAAFIVLLGTNDMTGAIEAKVIAPEGIVSATPSAQQRKPGFFPNMLDRKYILATHADNTLVAGVGLAPGVSSRPAQPGEEVVLWGTGFGPTSGEVLRVTVGGTDARVTSTEETVAGLYKVNVVIPSDLAAGDHAVQAAIGDLRTLDNTFLAVQGAESNGIRVYYRLDPWLVYGTSGEGTWASPPLFGPVTQRGPTFTLPARVYGLGANGVPTGLIHAVWNSADPEIATVTPNEGNQVTITVLRAGETSLQVTAQDGSKTLAIKAKYEDEALMVEIAQQP